MCSVNFWLQQDSNSHCLKEALFTWPLSASGLFHWKTIRIKVPYEIRKNVYGPIRNAYGPAKNNAKQFCCNKVFSWKWEKTNIPTMISIFPLNFRTPKCCNYPLKPKQQKESHYSRIKKLRNLLRANNRQTPWGKQITTWMYFRDF